MVIKSFNIDSETYSQFSEICRERGHSMSKKVENFIKEELERMKGNFKTERLSATEKIPEKSNHPMHKYC